MYFGIKKYEKNDFYFFDMYRKYFSENFYIWSEINKEQMTSKKFNTRTKDPIKCQLSAVFAWYIK
jgi:hypothetical protein